MFKNKGICDNIMYIKGMYNQDKWTCPCKILAHNAKYRFIENPFGGVDFYKVTRDDGDIIPIGQNLHKETIKRFLMKFNISDSSWFIRYPDELFLPHTMKLCGKVYERKFSMNQLYYGEMMTVKC